MKNIINISAMALLASGFWACGNNNTANDHSASVSGQSLLQDQSNRGSKKINLSGIQAMERLAADLSKVDVSKVETFTISNERTQSSEDAAIVVSLFNNLMTAESSANALNVEFSMSEEPVQDGVFIFTIATEEKQNLSFEMYDEEGFSLSANNKIQLVQGTNYKAINVSNLNSGNYIFKLKNQEGDALIRKINIQQQH